MKVLAALLLVCGACGGDDIELYPVQPGGGGPSSGTGARADASEGDGDSGVEIVGRVCVITDARTPTTGCATTGADGLVVALGTRMTTTMANGDFTIRVISGTNNVWRVTGTGIVPSAMTFATTNLIPALTTQTYADMTSTNNASFPGSGAIIARLRTNNAALTGATATTSPPPGGNVLYDSANSNITWDQTSTGGLGVVWVPGVAPTSNATMTVTNSSNQTDTVTNIPVFGDTITWLNNADVF